MQENQLIKEISSFNAGKQGTKTLTNTTTPTRLTEENQICRAVTIYARTTNTGSIYIGLEGLNTENYPIELTAGESVEIKINNTKNIFLLPTTNGDKINYLYVI